MKRLKIAFLILIGIIFSLIAAFSTLADPYIYHPYYAYDQFNYNTLRPYYMNSFGFGLYSPMHYAYYGYTPVNYLYNSYNNYFGGYGGYNNYNYYGGYNNYYRGYGGYNNYYYGGYGGYNYIPKPVYNPSRWWAW